MGLTFTPDTAIAAPPASTTKPSPTSSRPHANLAGLDGSRDPRRTHSHANTGARETRNIELTAWYHGAGNSRPKIRLSVLRFAKRFIVEPACSNTDQKIAAAINRPRITMSRLRSTGLHCADSSSHEKKTTTTTSSS